MNIETSFLKSRITRDAHGRALFDGWMLPDGPWHNEPDHVDFHAKDLPCILHRNPVGAWCGYVSVSTKHPWYATDYRDINGIECHGGLTYSKFCAGPVCHVAAPDEDDNVWWFGFDCNHHDDLSLAVVANLWDKFYFHHNHGEYRTLSYARQATEKLAEQLASVGNS